MDTETFIVCVVVSIALALTATRFFNWLPRQRCHHLLGRVEELEPGLFKTACIQVLVMHLAGVGGDTYVPGASSEEEEMILEELIELLDGNDVEWHEE